MIFIVAINTTYFPDTKASWYWSSTTYASNTSGAWGVDFDYGYDYDYGKSYDGYVRVVRGGQSGSSSPQPDIKANGQSGSITVSSTTSVSITAGLAPGTESGNSADWWLFCNTSGTWYSLTTGGWVSGVSSIFQAPLMAVSPVVIYNGYLPVGDYAFYFAVDLTPDGTLDTPLYYDGVQVHVTQ